ncbi:hypothetical protein BDQ17DRAFT_983954 [Cyathus striatus]|nr:hypothetical protein BDQ17DRAFT_983954 [Cyathus striatus]
MKCNLSSEGGIPLYAHVHTRHEASVQGHHLSLSDREYMDRRCTYRHLLCLGNLLPRCYASSRSGPFVREPERGLCFFLINISSCSGNRSIIPQTFHIFQLEHCPPYPILILVDTHTLDTALRLLPYQTLSQAKAVQAASRTIFDTLSTRLLTRRLRGVQVYVAPRSRRRQGNLHRMEEQHRTRQSLETDCPYRDTLDMLEGDNSPLFPFYANELDGIYVPDSACIEQKKVLVKGMLEVKTLTGEISEEIKAENAKGNEEGVTLTV